MNTGERISALRKEKGYSQEYVAQQIGVSRQAVHKWEKEASSPDTNNLIALAQVLDTTVEYIVSGNENITPTPSVHKKKLPKVRTYIITIILTAIITFIATVLYIANAPVAFDAGACGGGFATAVYDQYADQLIEENYFYLTRDFENADIQVHSISPVRESREVHYEGKAIYMSFDVKYTFSDYTTRTVKIRFMGERKWIQNYDWQMIDEYSTATENI